MRAPRGSACFALLRTRLVLLTISAFAFETGDVVSLFGGMDYSSNYALVNYRVKKLAYLCIKAVHQNRLVA